MRKIFMLLLACAMPILGCQATGGLESAPAAATVAAVDEEESTPVLDPMADRLLRDVALRFGTQDRFRFRAEISYDEMEVANDDEESDLKLQYEASVELTLRRPNKLRVSFRGDQINREFWYDGEAVTLLAPDDNYYGRMLAPPTVDEALDKVYDETGFSPPLSDLVYPDPYALLGPHVEKSTYLGLHSVRGVPCHHLLLVQEAVDWQIFIEASDPPLPRKLVITYKQVPGSPQYVAVWTEWDIEPDVPDSLFAFEAPKGAARVDMVPTTMPAAR